MLPHKKRAQKTTKYKIVLQRYLVLSAFFSESSVASVVNTNSYTINLISAFLLDSAQCF